MNADDVPEWARCAAAVDLGRPDGLTACGNRPTANRDADLGDWHIVFWLCDAHLALYNADVAGLLVISTHPPTDPPTRKAPTHHE